MNRLNAAMPGLVLVLSCLLVDMGLAKAETVRIGVLSYRPKALTQAQWQPLVVGLKRKLPDYDFVIEAQNYQELDDANIDSRFELLFTNPAHYIQLKYRHGLSAPLATVVNYQSGQAVSTFGGVIFTLAGRADLNRMTDLRGKVIAATDKGSFGGYRMQAYELTLQGMHPERQSSLLLTGMPHDRVVEAVLEGRADAGFVRSGLLEAMAVERKIDMSAFKVLNRQTIDYPVLLSTRLYPEWPIVTAPHVDARLARKLMAALLTLEDDTAVTSAINIQGFEAPADYKPVEDMLRALRVPPFDNFSAVTFGDLWLLYRWHIVATSAGLVIIAFLGLRLLRVNRQLIVKRRLVEEQSQRIKASEQLWKFALEGAGDGVWDWQVQSGLTSFSPRWMEMLGYQPQEFACHYPAWMDCIHEDDRAMVLTKLHDYLAGNAALYPAEFRMRCKKGQYKWILARGMAVEFSPEGKALRMVGTHSDIDERKQFQIRLQDSFDLLRNLARQIPGFIYQYQLFPDGRGCFPFVSAGIERIYEVTAEQVREDASPVFAVLHPDDVETVRASILASAQSLDPWLQEYRVVLPKAGLRWLLGNAQAERLADGSVLWYGYV
ncbi:MAG: PhnD/SsuA/transferrin family substrate-binding protein, partial [Methylomonas sp.]|nr:PhnD/SsuA/transferrin family substrate-binding protein [Methylomonas sp.]